MIPTTPQLPATIYAQLSDFEKDLLKKLTQLFQTHAREINNKTESQNEDIMYWMTRP